MLRINDIPLGEHDRLSPAMDHWLRDGETITLERAAVVNISAGGQRYTLLSPERVPARLLAEAGITLSPGDRLSLLGQAIDPQAALPYAGYPLALQVQRQVTFTLQQGSQSRTIRSSAASLGQALWEAGIQLTQADRLTPPQDTPLQEGMHATLLPARAVTIHTQAGEVSLLTAAGTIGEALAEAGMALQGLDESQPSASQPIPAGGVIRLMRVRDEVIVEQTPIPFETLTQPAPELEIDTQSIIQQGEYGLTARRVRVRYMDGVEVSRLVESEWTARQPVPRISGYGTNIVMRTAVVDGVEIQYWRTLTMWATSYHPAETGGNRTATGTIVERGVVAINPGYIPYGTQMYVPGYGTASAEDTGRLGARDIDLGYTDADYIPWHQYVTVYFLWPPPANIVWIIP